MYKDFIVTQIFFVCRFVHLHVVITIWYEFFIRSSVVNGKLDVSGCYADSKIVLMSLIY